MGYEAACIPEAAEGGAVDEEGRSRSPYPDAASATCAPGGAAAVADEDW